MKKSLMVVCMLAILCGSAWARIRMVPLEERVQASTLIVLAKVDKVEETSSKAGAAADAHLITVTVREKLKGQAGEKVTIKQAINPRRNHVPAVGDELIYFLVAGETKGTYDLALSITPNSTMNKDQVEAVRKAVAAEK